MLFLVHRKNPGCILNCMQCNIEFITSLIFALDGCTVFTDMSKDPTMFQGEGDYQFDIYRFTKEENG